MYTTMVMKRKYIWFNSIGIFFSLAFALATTWQWRFLFSSIEVEQTPGEKKHEVVSYADFAQNVSSSVKIQEENKMTTSTNQLSTSSTTKEVEEIKTNSTTVVTNEIKELSQTTAYNELQGLHEGVLINLDVPYTSQAPEKKWIDPWEDACEEASILMLDAYYKGYGLSPIFAKDEITKMIDWQYERGWFKSISIQQVSQLYEHFFPKGKQPRIVENPTAKQIKEFVQSGKPVLVVAFGKALPNKWYSNGGPEYHALIIRGFTDDSFITNDPGVNRGKNFAFPIGALMNSIHDWNDGNVPNGVPRIMILE